MRSKDLNVNITTSLTKPKQNITKIIAKRELSKIPSSQPNKRLTKFYTYLQILRGDIH